MILNKASAEPDKVISAPIEEPTPVLTLPVTLLLAWLIVVDPGTTVVFPGVVVPLLVFGLLSLFGFVVSPVETPGLLVFSLNTHFPPSTGTSVFSGSVGVTFSPAFSPV